MTNCSPPACRSISERPRHGRISAISPVIRCARLSLVETCAVTRQRCRALAVYSVSGVADRKLPPRPRKNRIFSLTHLFERLDGVGAVLARRSEAEFFAELLHELVVHPLPNAHRPIALHVRVHRAPGTAPRRAVRCGRRAGGSSSPPGSSRQHSYAASAPSPSSR